MYKKKLLGILLATTIVAGGCAKVNADNSSATKSQDMTTEAWSTSESQSNNDAQDTTAETPTHINEVQDTTAEDNFVVTAFPTIKSDVPDLDIIRVNDVFYMTSTTMNMCPGVPVMKSTDLVHWQIVNYVYDTFENDDITNLENGADMYSRGSWAASLKYDEATSLFYVAFSSNNHGFYVYTTDDIENGTWTKYHTQRGFHDPALFFEDGKMYVLSASGGKCRIQELALKDDGSIDTIGDSKELFSCGKWGLWEGAHVYKVNDYYYVFIIASPTDRWIRTQLCYRTTDLFNGEWEEKTLYQKGIGGSGSGLAQGGIVDTINGDWYAFAFQDRGGIGRAPSVVAVNWSENWPLMGAYDVEGRLCANDYIVKMTINLPESELGNYIVDSDEFDYESNEKLKLVWQWNHNPKNDYWSVTDNPGFLRLTTDTVVDNVCFAHNCLTQRTFAPAFESEIKFNTDNMKPGDFAGLCAMSADYGMVGVMCDENGNRYIYQANSEFKTAFENANEIIETPLTEGQDVYLKIKYDFKSSSNENTTFFYSLDGEEWKEIGQKFTLSFSTSTTFMGTRTWLFNYSTQSAGGFVDFDYYRIK